MNKQIEALKMAIEVLEAIEIENGYSESMQIRAIQVCKEALAEAEQKEKQEEALAELIKLNQEMGGYEAEKQEWQSLSDDEIEYLECLKAPPVHPDFINDDSWYEFARAIEQALKEKNYDLHKG